MTITQRAHGESDAKLLIMVYTEPIYSVISMCMNISGFIIYFNASSINVLIAASNPLNKLLRTLVILKYPILQSFESKTNKTYSLMSRVVNPTGIHCALLNLLDMVICKVLGIQFMCPVKLMFKFHKKEQT